MEEAPAPNSNGPNSRRAWVLWGITTASLLLLAAAAAQAVLVASANYAHFNMTKLSQPTEWAHFVGRYLWLGVIVLSVRGVREARQQDCRLILEWSLGSALIVLGLCAFVGVGLLLPWVRVQG